VVKKVEFVGDRMLYIMLGGHWCDIVLNVHTPSEDKCDDTNDSFYGELEEHVFDQFTKYDLKIFLEISIQKWEGKIFSNQHLGMRVYIKLVMIMPLE
jgi:hypothetical protein